MRSLATAVLACSLAACSATRSSTSATPDPAKLSIERGSDARAVAIAEEVCAAMGGRAAWERARILEWTFFGRRSHVWDKWTGAYQLDEGEKTIRMDLDTGEGRVFENGVEVADAKARDKELKRAKSVWINDSYWLVMPYKLLDPGVTLAWAGEGSLPDGRAADIVALTFEGVGDTPANKYEVWVSKDRHLVEQWSFFQDRDDREPKFTAPWTGWSAHGGILLCGGRGPGREITGIAVR